MSQVRLRWNQIFDGVVENVFDLKLVLVILMACAEQAKLVGKIQAFTEVFWCDKVERDFDAIVEIDDLMWRTGGDENGIAFVLNNCVTVDTFILETFSERCIDEPVLREDK